VSSAGRDVLRAFTAGQARRMNMGGSVRLDGTSPNKDRAGTASGDGKTRRITIGSSAQAPGPSPAGVAGKAGSRASVVWR
jgi:kinesin family protein 18/19